MRIQLVGPGGAGKSTVGALLAEVLGVRFIDLDVSFVARHGDVGRCIDTFGYRAYAQRNIDVYLEHLTEREDRGWVMALSSGFMLYPSDVHPACEACRQGILDSPTSFVLLPSLEPEACVRETVRRQLQRPFARSAEREAQVIRERFSRYRSLPLVTMETMAEPSAIARDIRSCIASMITIRRFRDGDEAALLDIYRSAVHRVARRDYTAEQVEAWAPAEMDPGTWAARIREIKPFVAESNGKAVGYADLQPTGYIHHFFVSGHHPRTGIGTLLMHRLLREAAGLGLTELTADVSRTAQPFFERFGFAVVERRFPVRRGVVIPNAFMLAALQGR